LTGPHRPGQDDSKTLDRLVPEPEEIAARETRALVVGPYPSKRRPAGADERPNLREAQARIEEAVGLAAAIDLDVEEGIVVPVSTIRPATYLGKGKVEELAGRIKADGIGL
jgi:GTP-binding protein HflX